MVFGGVGIGEGVDGYLSFASRGTIITRGNCLKGKAEHTRVGCMRVWVGRPIPTIAPQERRPLTPPRFRALRSTLNSYPFLAEQWTSTLRDE